MSERHDLDDLPMSWDITLGELKVVRKGLSAYLDACGSVPPSDTVFRHGDEVFMCMDMLNRIRRVIQFTETPEA